MNVDLAFNDSLQVAVNAAKRRGLRAGGAVVLAASDALAPKEPVPKHGENMVDTGFVKLGISGDGIDQAVIGYEAWWAIFPHENLEDHHPHGGQAKFLEVGAATSAETALGTVGAVITEALGL